jgi:hypothetical protein
MEGFFDLIGNVVAVMFLAAIPICFLKGRPGIGWFGGLAFLVGALVTLPLYRSLRLGEMTDWFWWWRIAGITIGMFVIVVAARPARPGSWWHRRGEGEARAGAKRDRSVR